MLPHWRNKIYNVTQCATTHHLSCGYKYGTATIWVRHDYEGLRFCGHKYDTTTIGLQYREDTMRLRQRTDTLFFYSQPFYRTSIARHSCDI